MPLSGKRKSLILLTLLLACSVFLTSCGSIPFLDRLLGGASYDIRNTVSDYLDQISNGLYANLDYDYFSVKDTKFAELAFTNEDAAEIMDEGMTRMSYEIGKISGSTRDLTGSCEVIITAVDVKEVLSDFDDTGIRKSDLLETIEDQDVPTLKTTIILGLSYDPSTKFWSVTDTAPLVKILGDPYTKITLEPDKGSPAALVVTFLTALADRDEEKALKIVPAIDPDGLNFGKSLISSLLDEYYSRFTFEYINTQEVFGGDTKVTFKISRPDFETALAAQLDDIEFWAAYLKPSLLKAYHGEDASLTEDDYEVLLHDLAVRVADAPCITENVVFTLKTDEQTGDWVLRYLPAELYNVSFGENTNMVNYTASAVLALDQLLEEGSIDLETHDFAIAALNEAITPSDNADGKGYGFVGEWSVPGGDYVYGSFDAATTTGIEYWLLFDQGVPEDTDFIYEWYNQGGTVLYSTTMDSLVKGNFCSWSCLVSHTCGALLPPDTYRLVVKINDGTVIVDEMAFIE